MYDEVEVGIIKRLYERHRSFGKVAEIMDIPKRTISRILQRDPNKPKQQRGPLKMISSRDNVIIKKYIRNCNDRKERVTARKIKNSCDLKDPSIRTVQRYVKTLDFVVKNKKTEIILSKKHKEARVKIASSWIAKNIDWTKVVFTDEKKFNLDGPDNWSTYIDENRELCVNKRQNNGGGIMVWGMITYHGYFHIIEMVGNFDSESYCDHIIDTAKPILDDLFQNEKYIFQQDNCKIHKSAYSSQYLAEIGLDDLDWPARSPDLNIIENCWSMMMTHIYNENCQYKTKDDLWQAIDRAVCHINSKRTKDIQNLYRSMPSRMIKVIQTKGDKLPY